MNRSPLSPSAALALAAALLCALPAAAWEPESPAAVQARITELQKAWEGKSADQIAQDKVARAKQKRPAWVDKSAWKLSLPPLTYYFAVGRASFPVGAAAPAGAAGAGGKAPTGRPLDWYYDEASGTFYTLVVDAR